MTQPTTAIKAHRFGKIVPAPDICGLTEVDEAAVPDDVAIAMEKAIRDGDPKKLSAEIKKIPQGARVSQAPTRKAESLLHLAAELGYFKCARILVNEGKVPIDICLRDKTQPIHYAAENAHEAALLFFIENGADIDCRNVCGETPLHLAAKAKQSSRIELYRNCIGRLVEFKADVNATDNTKCTPLLKASQFGRVNIVKSLIHFKANINAKDMFGHTALDIAEENGHTELIHYYKYFMKGDKVKRKCVIS